MKPHRAWIDAFVLAVLVFGLWQFCVVPSSQSTDRTEESADVDMRLELLLVLAELEESSSGDNLDSLERYYRDGLRDRRERSEGAYPVGDWWIDRPQARAVNGLPDSI